MSKINQHIVIVRSSISRFSSMSQISCDSIYAILIKHYTRVTVATVNNLSDLETLVAQRPDLVFLGMKLILTNPRLGLQYSDKIWISQYLDEHGVAYTGSSQKAQELELNKPFAKQRVLDAGLKTSPFCVAKQNQLPNKEDISLAYPLFIKPTDRGGGLGVDGNSVVYNFGQLRSKIYSITTKVQSDSLIEEYLPGREISVALLKDEYSNKFWVMPIERIVPPDSRGVRMLSPEIKHADAGLSVAVKDINVKDKVTALAINVFKALGARDYGRIDTRMDSAGVPHFLEANLIPSLIEGYGNFPKACVLNKGLDYESMILRIVRLGLARNSDVMEPVTLDGSVLSTFASA